MSEHLTHAERGRVRRTISRLLTVERREYPSASSPGTVYTARVETSGKTLCDCPGWTVGWRKSGVRRCKHTIDLIGNRATQTRGDFFLYIVRESGERRDG